MSKSNPLSSMSGNSGATPFHIKTWLEDQSSNNNDGQGSGIGLDMSRTRAIFSSRKTMNSRSNITRNTRSPITHPHSFFQPLSSSNDTIFSSRKRVRSSGESSVSPKKIRFQEQQEQQCKPHKLPCNIPSWSPGQQTQSGSLSCRSRQSRHGQYQDEVSSTCSNDSTKSVSFGDVTINEYNGRSSSSDDARSTMTSASRATNNSTTKSIDEYEAARLLVPRRHNSALLSDDGETKKKLQLLVLRTMMKRELEMEVLRKRIEDIKKAEHILAMKTLKMPMSCARRA